MVSFVTKDYERLYHQIGRLLASMPDMSTYKALGGDEVQQWLGRAHAAIDEVGVVGDAVNLRVTLLPRLSSAAWESAVREIVLAVHRAMAACELKLPPNAAGSFIPIASPFEAFAAVSKVLGQARSDVLIVDPYLDETVLTDFAVALAPGVSLRLLTDAATHKPSLVPAAARWAQQYGQSRPLEVRLAPAKALHDRAFFIDGSSAWSVTQSLKDLAKRSPAEIIRANDTAELKIAAYQGIWDTSSIVT